MIAIHNIYPCTYIYTLQITVIRTKNETLNSGSVFSYRERYFKLSNLVEKINIIYYSKIMIHV